MDKDELKALVKEQLEGIAQLRNARYDSQEFRLWRQVTKNVLRSAYGEEHIHYRRFGGIDFSPMYIGAAAVDEREHYLQGLNEAEPFLRALLFEIEKFGVVAGQAAAAAAPSPTPDARLALEIKDAELCERCMDLLAAPDKYDRAVREAGVVLEHRVRTMIKADTSVFGVNLMTQAFRKESGALILADDPAEQDGAHQLYRGMVGFLKNPTSHQLVTSYSRNRALEVIGFIDFLLDILQEAQRRNEASESQSDGGVNAQ